MDSRSRWTISHELVVSYFCTLESPERHKQLLWTQIRNLLPAGFEPIREILIWTPDSSHFDREKYSE